MKIMRINKKLNLTLLLRFGNYEKLKVQFDNNQIEFSCIANWIDYCKKIGDLITGDDFEGAFAHEYKIFNFKSLRDARDEPMDENLFINELKDGSYLLSYKPIILTPIVCFFGISLKNDLSEDLTNLFNNNGEIRILLDEYMRTFCYDPSRTGMLLIREPLSFIYELKQQIPNNLKSSKNLSSAMFYSTFNETNPIDAGFVDYNKYDKKRHFFDNKVIGQEIFWKNKDYEWQNEFRIAINNIHYVEKNAPGNELYNANKNKLLITLPNLHKYCDFFSMKMIDQLRLQKDKQDNEKCVFGLHIKKPN